jgi:D-alanyl-lipoteichoic acid acyltransferase DltB (MBOAT superfamily)
MLATFILVALAWVFFRAATIGDAYVILGKIFRMRPSDAISFPLNNCEMYFCLVLIGLLLIKEKWLPVIPTARSWAFAGIFILLSIATYLFGVFNSNQFIYFQF